MFDILHTIFSFLIYDIPLIAWIFLLLSTAPILLFSIKPQKPFWIKFTMVVFAIFVTYILLNLNVHIPREKRWHEYNKCQSQFDDGAIQHHSECGEINIADNASIIFYSLFGWIPAAAYVGFWEFLYRIWYRKEIKSLGKNHAKIWFSNILILSSIPFFCLVTYIVFKFISLYIDKYVFV